MRVDGKLGAKIQNTTKGIPILHHIYFFSNDAP